MSPRLALRLYYFVSFGAIGAYVPYFPAWLESRGVHGLEMSAITSLMPFVGLLSPLLFGVAADALGLRGSLLRIAVAGALVPFVLLSGLALLGIDAGYRIVFGAIAVYAFFRAPMVIIADVAALEGKAGYGRMRLFGSLGFAVVAVATGVLIEPTQRAALPTTIALCFVATFAVSFALPSRVERPPAPILADALRVVRKPAFVSFLAVAFLWCAAHVAYDLCFSLHVRDLSQSSRAVGVFWGMGVVSEVGLMAFASRLISSGTPARFFPICLGAAAFRFAMIAKAGSLGVIAWLQPLHAITFALMWVSCVEFVKVSAPPHLLATCQSMFSLATGLGAGIGMLVWGPMYARGGGALVFSSASKVAAVGAVVALLLAMLGKQARVLPRWNR
jgi:MFS transporter, PPP family, 3-phenylpropionic acid transporter